MGMPGLTLGSARRRFSPLQPNTAVIFGTSLDAQGDVGNYPLDPSSGSNVNGRGCWNWAQAYLHQRIDIVANAGISGNTSTQMLARVQTDVVTYDPGWVFVGGPVNDAPAGISSATTIANMTAIYQALRGRKIVQLNLAPRTDYDTTQKRADMSAVQEWFRTLHTTFPDVVVVDIWRVLANWSTTGPASGYTGDGTHWLEMAAERVGRAISTAISSLVVGHPKRNLGLLDPRNCLGNPGFATSGSGWASITATATTVTYPADDETPANIAQIVVSGNTDTAEHGVRYIDNTSSGRWSPGDIVQAQARIRWSGLAPYIGAAFTCHPFLHLRGRKTDDTFVLDVYGMFVPSAAYGTFTAAFPTSGDVVVKTARYTVPAGVDRLYFDVGWLGLTDGTIKVSEVSCSRLA